MTTAQFIVAVSALNATRRQLGTWFTQHDVWLSPTRPRVAEPWGRYHLGQEGIGVEEMAHKLLAPVCQYTLPHNVMGTPAISLPLAMHSSGLPIGVQLAAGPANEHLLLQLAARFETDLPWAERVPLLHVTKAA